MYQSPSFFFRWIICCCFDIYFFAFALIELKCFCDNFSRKPLSGLQFPEPTHTKQSFNSFLAVSGSVVRIQSKANLSRLFLEAICNHRPLYLGNPFETLWMAFAFFQSLASGSGLPPAVSSIWKVGLSIRNFYHARSLGERESCSVWINLWV